MPKNFNYKFENKTILPQCTSLIILKFVKNRYISFFIVKAGSVLTIERISLNKKYFHLYISLFSNKEPKITPDESF